MSSDSEKEPEVDRRQGDEDHDRAPSHDIVSFFVDIFTHELFVIGQDEHENEDEVKDGVSGRPSRRSADTARSGGPWDHAASRPSLRRPRRPAGSGFPR